jgi:hypothetical protein
VVDNLDDFLFQTKPNISPRFDASYKAFSATSVEISARPAKIFRKTIKKQNFPGEGGGGIKAREKNLVPHR